jgi:glycosyltransferase involved in cell wall biosynthesis
MKTKILIGVTSPDSYILLKGSLEYYKKNGFEVGLITGESLNLAKELNRINVEYLPIKIEREIALLSDLKSFFELYLKIRAFNPEIVNLGTPKIAFLGIIVSRLIGVKQIYYTCRGFRFYSEKGFKRRLLILIENLTMLFSHKVIFISKSLKEYADQNLICKSKYISYSPGSSNGINLKQFDPTRRDLAPPSLPEGWCRGDKIVVFVGRIIDRKGWDDLYHAFNVIRKEFNIKLLYVGDFEDSQIIDKNLKRIVQNDPDVLVTGMVSNVEAYLKVATVFVLPAHWEGFGNVLIQAAAMGIPIVSTDTLGCRDAVLDCYNGILIKPKDREALISRLKLLIINEPLRKYFGDNGRSWARQFDSVNVWCKLVEIYRNPM